MERKVTHYLKNENYGLGIQEVEKKIRAMKEAWKTEELELKEWKKTGIFIMSSESARKLQKILDENIFETQNIKSNTSEKNMSVLVEWDKWLENTNLFLELMTAVQSVFLYISPIFYSNILKKELQSDLENYQRVQKLWRVVTDKIIKEKFASTFCEDKQILESL